MSRSLIRYKHPIQVHLLHLTVWRDRDYRASQRTTGKGRRRQRIDWNRHNDRIVTLLVGALHTVSRRRSCDWHEPFQHLHRSVRGILNDEASDLPANLLEKPDVEHTSEIWAHLNGDAAHRRTRSRLIWRARGRQALRESKVPPTGRGILGRPVDFPVHETRAA